MKRIAIIGPGGAGKSTLAHQIGERLGLHSFADISAGAAFSECAALTSRALDKSIMTGL